MTSKNIRAPHIDNPSHSRHRVYQSAVNRFGAASIVLLALIYFVITASLAQVGLAICYIIVGSFALVVALLVIMFLLNTGEIVWKYLCGG
jgi:hypothetical protein